MDIGNRLRGIPTWLVVVFVPVAVLIAVIATSLASGQGIQATAEPPDTVVIKNFAFAPHTVDVKMGTTLTVVNEDDTTHTLTAEKGAFDTGDLPGGKSGAITLDAPGTYAFHCEIHPFMTGTIRVSR